MLLFLRYRTEDIIKSSRIKDYAGNCAEFLMWSFKYFAGNICVSGVEKMTDNSAGWSNPCFEIWMYAHFGEMPVIRESFTCCDRFAERFEKITGQKYFKNDRSIYQKLVQYGDEKKAIQMAERCYKRCVEDGKREHFLQIIIGRLW